jgi:hypothetical protein
MERSDKQPAWEADAQSSATSADVQSSGTGSRESLWDLELHVCPECTSSLVYPLDWMPMDAAHWRVSLRCPECEWSAVGVYEQSVLDRFDQVLDAGTDSLCADLRRLERSNMEDELQRFNVALGDDLILPEDF